MVFAHRRTNTHWCTPSTAFSHGVWSAQNKPFIYFFPLPASLTQSGLTGVSMKIQLQTLTMPFLVPSIKYPYSGEPRSPVCFPGSLYVQSRSGGRAGGRVMKTSRIVFIARQTFLKTNFWLSLAARELENASKT